MNMHYVDWVVVGALLVVIVTTAIYTKQFTQSVADFLAANRCAGRYLLCISGGMAGLGAITVIGDFEMYYTAGFTASWWMLMMTPLALIVALSGWVYYRYRETRAMTLAQFFEMRYSKRFRIFAGMLGWFSGIVNFGIFPAVGGRFFLHFCGLPSKMASVPTFFWGWVEIDLTYAAIMAVLLIISLMFVYLGGQIAVMVTDFIQGMFSNLAFLIIIVVVFILFDWGTLIDTLKTPPIRVEQTADAHSGVGLMHLSGAAEAATEVESPSVSSLNVSAMMTAKYVRPGDSVTFQLLPEGADPGVLGNWITLGEVKHEFLGQTDGEFVRYEQSISEELLPLPETGQFRIVVDAVQGMGSYIWMDDLKLEGRPVDPAVAGDAESIVLFEQGFEEAVQGTGAVTWTVKNSASRLHPFQTNKLDGFTMWYFVIGFIGTFYYALAWQGASGYRSAAKTAHEAKMANILGEWRGLVFSLLIMLLPIAGYVVMHRPGYQNVADEVHRTLSGIDNDTIARQVTVPLVLAKTLPIGVVGMFAAVMLAAFISTHDTYLHSWGSIFVQDVILPFRKKPFTPKQHFTLLRASTAFVALFIFLFSLFFSQNDYIKMFFAITGAIYLGGAGSAIIGGLYWKRGATSGAWFALITSATFAISGLILRQTWPDGIYPWLAANHPGFLAGATHYIESIGTAIGSNWQVEPNEFPFNGQWMALFAIFLSITGYVTLSLFEWLVLRKPAFNLERMLNRGEYAIASDRVGDVVKPATGWRALLPTSEFTVGDKVIYYAKLLWTIIWFGIFLFGTLYNLWYDVPVESWITFWGWKVGITLFIGVGTTIWFLIGGLIDIRRLFHILATMQRDHTDSGMVMGDRVYDEAALESGPGSDASEKSDR